MEERCSCGLTGPCIYVHFQALPGLLSYEESSCAETGAAVWGEETVLATLSSMAQSLFSTALGCPASHPALHSLSPKGGSLLRSPHGSTHSSSVFLLRQGWGCPALPCPALPGAVTSPGAGASASKGHAPPALPLTTASAVTAFMGQLWPCLLQVLTDFFSQVPAAWPSTPLMPRVGLVRQRLPRL